jgi:hypothetical protein
LFRISDIEFRFISLKLVAFLPVPNATKLRLYSRFMGFSRAINKEHTNGRLNIVPASFIGFHFFNHMMVSKRHIIQPCRLNLVTFEPIPYLPENFIDNDPLVIEILKNGIEIKSPKSMPY